MTKTYKAGHPDAVTSDLIARHRHESEEIVAGEFDSDDHADESMVRWVFDDHGDGRMDPGSARTFVAFVIVSLLAMWGTVDLTLRVIAWWWS